MSTHTPAPGWLCLLSKVEIHCFLYQWSLICTHGSWKMPSLLGGSCDMPVVSNKNLSPDGGMHRVHPAKQVLPDKGNSSSVVGSSKSLAWGAGGLRVQRLWEPLTNPSTLPWLERKKGRRMPGGTGWKQKSRDRIYSYEHVTLLLIVLIPWEDSIFS